MGPRASPQHAFDFRDVGLRDDPPPTDDGAGAVVEYPLVKQVGDYSRCDPEPPGHITDGMRWWHRFLRSLDEDHQQAPHQEAQRHDQIA